MKTRKRDYLDYLFYGFVIGVFIIAVSSCTVSKKTTHEETKKDSIRIEYKEKVIYKDSLVKVTIPADKELLKVYFECDSLNQLQFRQIERLEAGKNVKAKVEIRDNIIYVDCEVDSLFVYSIWSKRFETITSDLSEVSSKVVVDTEKKRVVPWWFYLVLFGASVVSACIGIFIGKYL